MSCSILRDRWNQGFYFKRLLNLGYVYTMSYYYREPYVSFSDTEISLESDLEAVVSGLCQDKFIDSKHSFKLIVSLLQTFIFWHMYVCGVHACMHVVRSACICVEARGWCEGLSQSHFPWMYWMQSVIITTCLRDRSPVLTSNMAKIRGKPPQLFSVYLRSGDLNLTRILRTGSGFVLCCYNPEMNMAWFMPSLSELCMQWGGGRRGGFGLIQRFF